MPYDPNIPQAGTEIDADQMRGQLNGLKDLIDAISTITAAQVDAVNSVPPDSPAQVNLSVTGNTLHFSFDLPRGYDGNNGADGEQGPPGNDGIQGQPGNDGAQGPPFAQAVVDGVNTLEPWESAAVDVSFDGSNVRFTFGIPRGNDGSNGSDGAPGEVSLQQLDDAISGTSANTNTVSTLDNSYADPEMEELRQKLNELIVALRRL
jgi:hypothetical protein